MLKTLTNAGLALAVTAASLALPVSFAQAQDVQFRVGPDGVRIYDRDAERDRYRDRDRERFARERFRGCSPAEAEEAARDSGFRRARVVRVTDRSVVVEGFTRRGPDRIVFANRRGCPEL